MNFLSRKTNTVEKSAIIIGVFTLLSSILGILRNTLLASYLGASRNIDIYYASFRIPDFIFNIFIMGAITAGLIPLFSKYIHTKKEEANSFINSIIFLILLLSFVFGLVLIIFATPIIEMLFKGMDASSKLMIVKITRIVMIQPIVLGLSAILGNVLLVYDFVLSFALAPLLYNLGIIFGIVVLYPKMGLVGLAWGVVAGAILNLIVKLIPLKLTGFEFQRVPFKKILGYAKEFGVLIIPRTLSVINIQIFVFVINYFASFLEPGKLGIFNLANSFQELPQTIFATSIAMAAFPVLSRLFHQNNIEGMRKLYLKSFHQINFIMLLISAGLFVLSYPLVKILLNYGNFDLNAISVTAGILQIMAIGLSFSALLLLNLDTLFALGDMMTPLLASFFAYGLGSFLIWVFYRQFGVVGITIALVIANAIYCKIMTLKIIFKLEISKLELIMKVIKNLSIAILSGIMGWMALRSLENINTLGIVDYLLYNLIIPTLVILGVYILLAKLLKIEEANDFWKLIINKLKRN